MRDDGVYVKDADGQTLWWQKKKIHGTKKYINILKALSDYVLEKEATSLIKRQRV